MAIYAVDLLPQEKYLIYMYLSAPMAQTQYSTFFPVFCTQMHQRRSQLLHVTLWKCSHTHENQLSV